MPWFHRESAEERARKEAAQAAAAQEAQLQERSLQALREGGLPIRAQERVSQLRAGAGQAPLFTSDLSADELVLLRRMGYQPLGLASGSSVYHIGRNRWTYTGELAAETRALGDAVRLATDRLRQEARGMGAVGVVGTRLEFRWPEWGERLVEVVVVGTALRVGAGPAGEPFISALSGQEFHTLLKTGGRPLGLAFGNCTYYIYTTLRAARQNMSWYNQEVHHYTAGLREAQREAFGRMHAAGAGLEAHGVVGVHIAHTLTQIPNETQNDEETRIDYLVDYIAWGTAIHEAHTQPPIDPPSVALDLEEARRTSRSTAGTLAVLPVARE